MQLQDAEVTGENKEKFRLLCEEFEDIFSKSSSDIGKTPLITMDIDTEIARQCVRDHIIYHLSTESGSKKN